MSQGERPLTHYLVGASAVIALLVLVGLRLQDAAMTLAPPEQRPPSRGPAAILPVAVLAERAIGLCETERIDGQEPSVPPSGAPPIAVDLGVRSPAGQRPNEPLADVAYVLLVGPGGGVRKAWPVFDPAVSYSQGEYHAAVLAALQRWKVPASATDGQVPQCSLVMPRVQWQ